MAMDWCLRRLGTSNTPDYALQPHIPVITGTVKRRNFFFSAKQANFPTYKLQGEDLKNVFYNLRAKQVIIKLSNNWRCFNLSVTLSALSISRLHVEFHQLRCQSNESKLYWQIKDPGSASGVFVNKHRIPKNDLIRLNDGDIIGVGGNFKEEDIRKSSTKSYLLKVVAPDEWGQEEFANDNNEDSKSISALI